MYRYDEFDQAFVESRVAEFRDQVDRRLSGALTEEQFRPLRLMNGLYLQLHAYMLRVAIPYGTLSPDQMRMLGHIARKYDKGFGHFTTRQNIQYNWPALVDTPDILADLASVQMHAIQTSGNCIRNVTSDPFAGVAADEIEDPRPWCEIIRQWSTLHPEFSFLPRKFKIAVTAAEEDRAAISVHDIGLRMVRNDRGEVGFKVFVGGGMGRTPLLGKAIRDFLPKPDLLSYLEAILRVYNRFGRRDNKFKARIKILVEAVGAEAFAEMVEAEWKHLASGELTLPQEEMDRIEAYFAPPAYDDEETARGGADAQSTDPGPSEPDFLRWARQNVAAHKQPGYAIVSISLKPAGGVPGDASASQMDFVADLAERYSHGELRVTHHQNLVLPYVRQRDLGAVWAALREQGLATANIGLVSDIIACPGLDYCSLANARSIPIAQQIQEKLADPARQEAIGPLRVNISGCINACGHHHVGEIGILGVDKKGVEMYQLMLGGSSRTESSLAQIVGRGFGEEEIAGAVETVVDTYLDLRQSDEERFVDTYRRVGPEPFKERLYAAG